MKFRREVFLLLTEILLSLSGRVLLNDEEGAFSLTDCSALNETILFESEHFNNAMLTSLNGFENKAVTALIPWDYSAEKEALRRYLTTFHSGILTKCGVVAKEPANYVLGAFYTRDKEYILVPDFSVNKSLDDRLSQLFFFRNIVKTVEKLRIIVMVDAAHPQVDLPEVPRTTLKQIFMLFKNTVTVHLVIVERGPLNTSNFQNFIFFRSQVSETLSSCDACTPHTLSWWITQSDDINRNFPFIQYSSAEVKSLQEIFTNGSMESDMRRAYMDLLQAMRCLVFKKSVQIWLRMREYFFFKSMDFEALNELYQSQIAYKSTIDSLGSVSDDTDSIMSYDIGHYYNFPAFGGEGVEPSNHEHQDNSSRDAKGYKENANEGDANASFAIDQKTIRRLKEILHEYGYHVPSSLGSSSIIGNAWRITPANANGIAGKIAELLNDINLHNSLKDNGTKRSIGSLAPVDPSTNSTVFISPFSGLSASESSSKFSHSSVSTALSASEKVAIPGKPAPSCSENLVISGSNLDSNAIKDNCEFTHLEIVATQQFSVKSNLTLPFGSLNIKAKKFISEGPFYINLSAKDCVPGDPHIDKGGGIFQLSVEEFEGVPLTVIVNGGNGCPGRDSPEEIRNLPIVEVVDGNCVPVQGSLFPSIWNSVYKATDGSPGTERGEVTIKAGDGRVDWSSSIKVVALDGTKGKHGRTGETKIYCDDEKFYSMIQKEPEDDDGKDERDRNEEEPSGEKRKPRWKRNCKEFWNEVYDEGPVQRINRAENDLVASLTYRDKIHIFTHEIATMEEANVEKLFTWIKITNDYRKMFQKVMFVGSRVHNSPGHQSLDVMSGKKNVSKRVWSRMPHPRGRGDEDEDAVRRQRRSIHKENSPGGDHGYHPHCYPVSIISGDQIDVLPCGINMTYISTSKKSTKVAGMLKNTSIKATDCREVNQNHISEYHLVICNRYSQLLKNPMTVNENLTCFDGLLKNSVACRLKKHNIDFEEIARVELDYLSLILTIKYARTNPVKAMTPVLTDDKVRELAASTQETKSSSSLRDIYFDSYKSLAAACDLYFDKVLRPATRITIPKLSAWFLDLLSDFENGAGVMMKKLALALRFNAFLRFRILRSSQVEDSLRGFILNRCASPELESMTGSSHRQEVQRIWGEEIKDLLLERVSSVMACLELMKSEINKRAFPEELKNMIVNLLTQFSESIKKTMLVRKNKERNNATDRVSVYNARFKRQNGDAEEELGNAHTMFTLKNRNENVEHLLQKYRNIMNKFKEDAEKLRTDLSGKHRRLFEDTVGAYLRASDRILDVIHNSKALLQAKTDFEKFLQYGQVIALSGKGTYQNLYTEYEKYKMYMAASFAEETELFLSAKPVNALYITVLFGLQKDREELKNMSAQFENADFFTSLKSKICVGLDLREEVYKALQLACLTEHIERNTAALIRRNVSGEVDAIEKIQQALKRELTVFKLESAKKSMEQLVFPFAEKLSPDVSPEAFKESFTRLKAQEREYKKYTTTESRDPEVCINSCPPLYSWSTSEVKAHGQSIDQFYEGHPLFLLAYPKNTNPETIKSKNFRIRFLPRGPPDSVKYKSNLQKIARYVAGTYVRLSHAAFSYNMYDSQLYLGPAINPTYELLLGSPAVSSINNNYPTSPYTLWRIRLNTTESNIKKIRCLIGGIELVGEGEIPADRVLFNVHKHYRNDITTKDYEHIWLEPF